MTVACGSVRIATLYSRVCAEFPAIAVGHYSRSGRVDRFRPSACRWASRTACVGRTFYHAPGRTRRTLTALRLHRNAFMPEAIAEPNYVVSDDSGRQYFPTVVAEPIAETWEAWLEFVPADDSPPLLTNTETTQSTREDIVRWATLLDDVYIQGAFRRAVSATASAVRSPISVLSPPVAIDTTGAAAEDPFEMYRLGGKQGLRARLQPLTRTELLLIIDGFQLNPAQLSLARLTTSQLVTFIATAVEVQALQGRR